jgi:hypothetical protein
MRCRLATIGTLAALLLSLLVGLVWAEETEEQAVAALGKLGGTILGTKDRPGNPVYRVILRNTNITDPSLAHLKNLKTLEWLDLKGTKVSDAGLVYLKDLNQLRVLLLNGTKVSDAGLVHLNNLNQLRCLSLNGTKVSDAGLVHFKELKTLEWLDLRGTKVSDAGIKQLKKALPKVKIRQSGS